MNLSPDETRMVDSYLAEVGQRLSAEERDETLAGLRSHIHEAVAARAGEGPGVVEAVLAGMDSPDQYGSPEPGSGGERFCKLALIGALLLPWGLPVLWHVIRLTPAGENMKPVAFYEHPFYQFVFLPLALISMVIATVLGWQSLKRITNAGGALTGLALAVLDAVFYPLLFLNLVLFIAFANAMDVAEFTVASFLILVAFLLLLLGNIYIYRATLRSFQSGQPLWRKLVIPGILYILMFAGLIALFSRGVSKLTADHQARFDRIEQEARRTAELIANMPESISSDDLSAPWVKLVELVGDEQPLRASALEDAFAPNLVDAALQSEDLKEQSEAGADSKNELAERDLKKFVRNANITEMIHGSPEEGVAGDRESLHGIMVSDESDAFLIPLRYIQDSGWRLGKCDFTDALLHQLLSE